MNPIDFVCHFNRGKSPLENILLVVVVVVGEVEYSSRWW